MNADDKEVVVEPYEPTEKQLEKLSKMVMKKIGTKKVFKNKINAKKKIKNNMAKASRKNNRK